MGVAFGSTLYHNKEHGKPPFRASGWAPFIRRNKRLIAVFIKAIIPITHWPQPVSITDIFQLYGHFPRINLLSAMFVGGLTHLAMA